MLTPQLTPSRQSNLPSRHIRRPWGVGFLCSAMVALMAPLSLATAQEKPILRFAAYAEIDGNDFNQTNAQKIQDDILQLNEEHGADIEFILVCGDITEDGNKDAHWQKAMNFINQSPIPFQLLPGNHDATSVRDAKGKFLGTDYRKYTAFTGNELMRSFSYLDERVLFITGQGQAFGSFPTPEAGDYFQQELDKADANQAHDFVFVATHTLRFHPPTSSYAIKPSREFAIGREKPFIFLGGENGGNVGVGLKIWESKYTDEETNLVEVLVNEGDGNRYTIVSIYEDRVVFEGKSPTSIGSVINRIGVLYDRSTNYLEIQKNVPAEFHTNMTFFVNNQPPTNIALSSASIAENKPITTLVGNLTTTDANAGDRHTYTLVSGDTGSFALSGNQLLTAASFDFETKSSYSLTIRTTDANGLTFDKDFTISVADLSEDGITSLDVTLDETLITDVMVVDLTAASTNGGWLTFKATKNPNTASNQVQKLTPTTPIAYFERKGADSTFRFPVANNGGWRDFGENNTVARTFIDGSGPLAALYDSVGTNPKNAVPTLNTYKSGTARTDEWYGYNIDVSGRPVGTTFTGRFYYTELNHKPRFQASLLDAAGNVVNSMELSATSSNSQRTGVFTAVGTITPGVTTVRIEAEHVNEGGGTHYFRLGGLSFSTSTPTEEVNTAPTNIALSSASIAENQPIATVVGNLTTTDANAGDSHTYTLVSGDTGSFTISGNQLRTAASFDFETKNSYNVTVRTTDTGGLSFDKAFTVSVTDVSEVGSTSQDASGTVSFGGDGAAYDSVQDGQGGKPTSLNVSPDNLSVTITGNAWKRFPLTYTVTANTMLQVTISGSDTGEIVGLALDNDTAPTTGRRGFLFGGSDYANTSHNAWSWKMTPIYNAGDAARTYVIPVGTYFTGAVSYLGLIGDDDADGSTNVTFANVRLYEPSGYTELSATHDWGSTPVADRAPTADANGNGIENLLEFAFNMSPTAPGGPTTLTPGTGTSGLPAVSVITPATPTLRIEYLRRKNSGLSYEVKFSDDLVTWEDAVATPTPTSINTSWERMVMPDTAGSGRKKRFAKVEVTE